MKKFILSVLAFLLFSIGAYTQCFTPVWTEPSRDSMLIYVSIASLNGTNLQIGDEIGVFDREECVGVGVLTEELTGAPIYLEIEVPRQFLWWEGFRPGDTITYRFCSGGEIPNPAVTPTYISNGPTFVANGSCIVELRAINTAPAITSIPDTVALEGVPYVSSITAVDIDGDSLTYSAPILPTWLSFNDTTHILSGTPDHYDVGDNSVALRINDGTVDVIQDFVIEVENINDPPTITSDPVTEARPGVAYSYTITAEDVDGDDLTYTAIVLPGWLEFNASTHTLAATPGEGDVGDQHVTIRVSDGSIHIDHTFIITVDCANHAPTFTSNPATSVVLGESYEYAITAQDIDSDPLRYTAPVLPDWLTFFPETHVISGIPQIGDLGIHDVTLRVSDGSVSADQSFPILVKNVNTVPSFTSTPLTYALEGYLYEYYATAEDADEDPMAFSAPLLPDWLSFDVGTQNLYGTPNIGDLGDHHVTLRVSDGEGAEDQNFVITVEVQSGVGVDDFSSPDFMVVYPNPSDGRFFVELCRELESEVILEILDPMGKILLHQEFPPYLLINEAYKLSGHPAGIYFIRIFSKSLHTTRKLMIQ